jgi:hypothetical protein
MSERRPYGATWSFAATLAALGGFLAAVGALLPWASGTGTRTTEIFGEQVLGTVSASGTQDVTGLAVLVLGLAVGVLEVVALLTRGARRAAGSVAVAGGIVVLAACALAAVRTGSLLGELPRVLRSPEATLETGMGVGLLISAAGGLVAAAGGMAARWSSRER